MIREGWWLFLKAHNAFDVQKNSFMSKSLKHDFALHKSSYGKNASYDSKSQGAAHFCNRDTFL
jgi:hypothetical protein